MNKLANSVSYSIWVGSNIEQLTIRAPYCIWLMKQNKTWVISEWWVWFDGGVLKITPYLVCEEKNNVINALNYPNNYLSTGQNNAFGCIM